MKARLIGLSVVKGKMDGNHKQQKNLDVLARTLGAQKPCILAGGLRPFYL